MLERSHREAGRAFIEALQQAISCISPVVVVGNGTAPRSDPYVALVNRGLPVRLAGAVNLALSMRHYYQVSEAGERGLWHVQTAGYLYAIETPDGRELVAYHWHPNERSAVTFPHLHLGSATEIKPPIFTAAHLPTGPVSLQAIIRFAITDLNVRPQRADWERVLAATSDVIGTGGLSPP